MKGAPSSSSGRTGRLLSEHGSADSDLDGHAGLRLGSGLRSVSVGGHEGQGRPGQVGCGDHVLSGVDLAVQLPSDEGCAVRPVGEDVQHDHIALGELAAGLAGYDDLDGHLGLRLGSGLGSVSVDGREGQGPCGDIIRGHGVGDRVDTVSPAPKAPSTVPPTVTWMVAPGSGTRVCL